MYNVEVKQTGISKVLLEIKVSETMVNDEFKRCCTQAAKEAEIPGFRKGKAPLEMVKAKFDSQIYQQALQNLVSEYYINALRERQVFPVEHPHFEIKKFAEGNELIFTAEFEVRPEFEIPEYKGLKIDKRTTAIKPEEIDKGIDYLRETKAEFSSVLENRPVQEGDFLVADYQCHVDSKVVDNKKNVLLSTKDTAFPKEFIEGLVGSKIGDEKEINITLPPKFSDNKLAGRPAKFMIKIHDIKKKNLPQASEEFAKDMGFDSLEKLKVIIEKDIKAQKENYAKIHMREQAIQQLIEKTQFQLPENMLKEQTDMLVSNTKEKIKAINPQRKEEDLNDETLAKKLRPEAEKQLKTFFIFDKIAEKENISVSEEELNDRLNILAVQSNQSVAALRKTLEEKELISQIEGQIKDEKILDFILNEAEIKEIEITKRES
ncbi:MAG: trigger factor [Candidatus Omnitrophota bacterium]